MMMRHFFLFLAFVLFTIPACHGEDPKTDMVSIVTANGKAIDFTVEIADTPERRTLGLMFRKDMPEDHGMLFLFEDEQPRAFWMKNTFLPLDILFIRADGVVGHVHENAIPHDETSIPSQGPAYGVLEINGGRARALGIRPGDIVHHKAFGNVLAKRAVIH